MLNVLRDERRRYLRVGAELAIRLCFGDTLVSYPAAFTRDVSAGGFGVEIGGQWLEFYEELVSWQGPLEAQIDLSSGHTIQAVVAVVWGRIEREEGDRRFTAGLRLLALDRRDEVCLKNFVKAKAEETSPGRAN